MEQKGRVRQALRKNRGGNSWEVDLRILLYLDGRCRFGLLPVFFLFQLHTLAITPPTLHREQ